MGQGQMGEMCRKWLLLAPSMERCKPAFKHLMYGVRLGWKHHLCPSGRGSVTVGRARCAQLLSLRACV